MSDWRTCNSLNIDDTRHMTYESQVVFHAESESAIRIELGLLVTEMEWFECVWYTHLTLIVIIHTVHVVKTLHRAGYWKKLHIIGIRNVHQLLLVIMSYRGHWTDVWLKSCPRKHPMWHGCVHLSPYHIWQWIIMRPRDEGGNKWER